MKKLKVAVIGVGHLGKEHARIYHELPQVELTAVCDVNSSERHRAETLNTRFAADYHDLLGQTDIASIVTPTSTHYQIARDFLSAGAHVLIEKPITTRLEEADELISLAREKNLALQVGHLERYNAALRRIGEIAKNIRFVEIHRLGPFNARISDCGVVLDLMIHDIDILLQLVKSEIESIDAIGINVLTPYEDIANARIKFKNKTIADVTASRLTPDAQRKIRIFQEDAYISLDYVKQSAQIYRKKSFPQALIGGPISREEIDIQKGESLKAELEDFIESTAKGTNHGKPDVAARNALQVALQVLESIKQNAPQPLDVR